ncbi:MAG: tRNA (adenosine(37)-N6)-threonylcarbamoyltransferase complex dimerization subunit type 1 TsaB [Flavobacteriales bacterium]
MKTPSNHYILAIETSTAICSVALSKHGVFCDERIKKSPKPAHGELLLKLIQELLDANNISQNELSAIAFSVGPGSFTGLRIGAATAKGLAFALNIPLIGIDTMTLPLKGLEGVDFLSVMSAQQNEIFVGFGKKSDSKLETELKALDTSNFEHFLNRELTLVGNATDLLIDCLGGCPEHWTLPTNHANYLAKDMLEQANRDFLHDNFLDLAYFEPRYLKAFKVTMSKKNRL